MTISERRPGRPPWSAAAHPTERIASKAGVMTDLAAEEIGDVYFQDPQGVFARLRATAPVTPVIMPSGDRAWLVTRYDDVRAALNDQRLTKDWTKHVAPEQREGDPVRMALNRHLLTADPPDCAAWS
jgi:cytochrome P450